MRRSGEPLRRSARSGRASREGEPLSDTWLLRWERDEEPRPSVARPDRGAGLTSFAECESSFCVFDGYLLEPRPRPGDRGSAEATPAETVLNLWKARGRDTIDQLRGGYAFAIWDYEEETLVAVRDATGIAPLFYSKDDRLLLVSPSLDRIRAEPRFDDTINSELAAEMLVLRTHDLQLHETYYRKVSRLPSAHLLRVTGSAAEIVRYWDPVPFGFDWASDEELATFPELLERAVERCLEAGADSIGLSGGFDSVGLAVLASRLRAERRPLHALSLRFTGTASDEGETQIAVAEALGMPQTLRPLHETLQGRSLLEDALAHASTTPSPILSPFQAAYVALLSSGRELGLSGLMLGTGGDDLLSIDTAWGADCIRRLQLGELLRFYQACRRTSPFSAARVARIVLWTGGLRRVLLEAGSHVSRRIPYLHSYMTSWHARRAHRRLPWLTEEVWGRMQERQSRVRAAAWPTTGESGYRLAMRRLLMSPLLMLEMDQGSAWARKAGFRLFLPYFDRDVVSLLLRIHPGRLMAGGYFKAPLRELVKKSLPEVPLPRKKVDFTGDLDRLFADDNGRSWESVRDDSKLVELGILEPRRLDAIMGEDPARAPLRSLLSRWQILSTEAWLRSRAERPVLY